MRLSASVVVLSCILPAASAIAASSNVAGQWNVTVRMPNGAVTEQWTLLQKGSAVTGTAKGEHGELPVSGTIAGAFFRVTVKDGQKEYKVRATVDGSSMDGSIAYGVGNEDLWFAKRATARGK